MESINFFILETSYVTSYFIMSWYSLFERLALNIANVFYSKSTMKKKNSFSSYSHVLIFLILAEGVSGAVWKGGVVCGE